MIATMALLTALSLAQTPAPGDPERQARQIETMVIAPCCFSQQVSVHQSPAAEEVRRDIRVRLAAGQTQEEILDAYVARYGKRILAVPPASGFDLTLYVAPVIALLASVALVVVVVRRFTAHPPPPEPLAAGAAPRAGTALETRLDDELRDLD